MSLFPCRICERLLSKTAEQCPGCGEKHPNTQKYQRYLLVRYVIPGLLFLGGVLYGWMVLYRR
jgi:hypothetical protein